MLSNISNTIEESINELKKIYENISHNKEELKLNIQKIFTKIRNTLNEREDKLLLDVDKQFNILYCNEDIIKENVKLPNKIKLSLEKGKIINEKWNEENNQINSLINDCINIENNIKEINIINENIKKFNTNKNQKIIFSPEENDINIFLESIKIFGNVFFSKFSFKKCPINISENKQYSVSGENNNILIKTGKAGWTGAICEYSLEKSKEHRWKIKILKNQSSNIMVGVAPCNFDNNKSNFSNCGWYLHIESYLYSGPPHNYSTKGTNLKKVNNEIIMVMNMKNKSLKFIINNEDKGESYTNIPIDNPITPAVFLYNINDSIEIIECN